MIETFEKRKNFGRNLQFIGFLIIMVEAFVIPSVLSKYAIKEYDMQVLIYFLTGINAVILMILFMYGSELVTRGLFTSSIPEDGQYCIVGKRINRNGIYLLLSKGDDDVPIYFRLFLKEFPDLQSYEISQKITFSTEPKTRKIELQKNHI